MNKKVLKSLSAIFVSVVLLSSLNCIPVHASSSVKHLRINPQFLEWNIDEEAVRQGKNGDTAGTVTGYLLVGLAFNWNANETPVGAQIGGCTLTAADGWLNQTKGLVEDMHTFAAVLPSIEHYDECTPYVPDDLLESGLWIAGGVQDEAFAAALLNDPRIDAQGLLYITETDYAYVDAEDESDKQAVSDCDMSFFEISACLRPLEFTEVGDLDGDGLTGIIKATEAGKLHEVYPVANPTPECVSYLLEGYSYEGVAITCADIDVLKENGMNGVPVEWSDGIWSSYWQPSGTEFLIQPIEGLSKEFGFYGKYEHFGDEVQDDGKENSFPIPAECTGLDEPVYVLYTPKADAARLEAVLASDRSVTVIGALFCGILRPVNEKGDILDIMPYRAAATTAKIVSFTPKAIMGDVDGDGKVTAYDATLALTAFSEKTAGYADGERTLTPAQEQIADVDGDGELTAFDATMILTYFNLKFNTGYDDLTWADVLPEA